MITALLPYHFAQVVKSINDLPHGSTQNAIPTVLTIVFGILGGVSVIMVIIGGINYIGSQGDPSATAKGKNTIIYALVGIAVALFGATIVKYVLTALFK